MTTLYPPPWNLTGNGYILLFHFPKEFIDEKGFVPNFLKGKFHGGIGAIMLVDYNESNAGSYQELLFIPGKFNFLGRKLNSITKIYVSTEQSVVNGKINWGIPKELALFNIRKSENTEQISLLHNGAKIAEFELSSKGFKFPVNTKFMPFPLVQEYEGKNLFTTFQGKGKGQLAKLKKATINSTFFPDFNGIKPLLVIKVSDFHITFPKSIINQ